MDRYIDREIYVDKLLVICKPSPISATKLLGTRKKHSYCTFPLWGGGELHFKNVILKLEWQNNVWNFF